MPRPNSSPESPLARTHDNTVTIDDTASQVIQSISYVTNSLQITDGQPSDPPATIEVEDHVFEITMKAGRKGSEDVANSFTSACGDASKEYAPSRGGGTPDELNFYFAVTIQFTNGGVATVYLAQGNSVLTNNWWIGGGPIFSEDTPRLEYTAGNQVFTLALSGNHETFELKQTDVRPLLPIQYVFVLMLENHSFDNMFALSGISGIYAATTGDSNSYNGTSYSFHGNAPESMPTDPGHEFTDVVEQLAGQGATYPSGGSYPAITNSGFAANYAVTTTEGPAPPAADIGDIMAGFDTAQQLPTFYDLAATFVLCDQWFSSLPGPTWPNRFFLHGASSAGLDHSPTTPEIAEWETIDGFKYPNGSIYDAMNTAGITWRVYRDTNGSDLGAIPQVTAIHDVKLWRDVSDVKDFAADLQNDYPYQYTFIEPNYGDIASGTYENGTSQHPMDSVAGGEGLIATVYEAIRNSPLWESSLLIVTYDEHGGFYDHFPPGSAPAPDDGSSSRYNRSGFTFEQYGVRVPAVVASPWTEKGAVDHTVYDHSSVLATLEWIFGLTPLTNRDRNATSLHPLLMTGTLRKDAPKTLKRPVARPPARPRLTAEERAARDLEPIPEGSTLTGMLGVLLKADSELTGHEAAVARFASVKTRGHARVYIREVLAKVEAARASRKKP